MSAPKVPNQFPWIVVGVFAVHAVAAIFLFGGPSDPSTSPGSKSSTAPVLADATPATPTGTQHPLGRPDAITATEATTMPLAEADVEAPPTVHSNRYGKADNEHFEPRFPKRIPLQSELTNEMPTPVRKAGDVFEMAENKTIATEPVAESENEADDETPSAVAAARAVPVTTELLDEPAIATNRMKGAANRLRMIDTAEPMPIPQPRPVSSSSAAPAVTMQLQPINRITQPEPENRTRPAITKIEPKLPPVAEPVAHPVEVEESPAPPSTERKFRVVKPIN